MSYHKVVLADFVKTCRLCLAQDGDMVSVFDDGVDSPSLATKIKLTVSLEVSNEDGLPVQICKQCYQRIDEWYRYRLGCHNTDTALQRYVRVLQENLTKELHGDPMELQDPSGHVEYSLMVSGENLRVIGTAVGVDGVELSNSQVPGHVMTVDAAIGIGGLEATSVSPSEMIKHLTCSTCGKVFSRYNNRMMHEKRYHKRPIGFEEGPKQYKCQYCAKEFTRIDYLRTHEMRLHSRERPFECECGTGFVRQHDMIWHQNTHVTDLATCQTAKTDVTSFVCCICNVGDKFSKLSQLNEHIAQIHIARNFKCTPCNMFFLDDEELQWHNKCHNEDETEDPKLSNDDFGIQLGYRCEICRHMFPDLNLCKSHLLRVHSILTDFTCTTCAKTFQGRSDLVAHQCSQADMMQGMSDDHDMEMSLVGQIPTFDSGFMETGSSTKKSHQSKKESLKKRKEACDKDGNQSYFCCYCGKKFPSMSDVRTHERRHTPERRYLCNECGKAFSTGAQLKAHALTHTDVKPYTCDVCSMKFRTLSNLNAHKKRHTDQPNFVCQMCGKEFLTLSGFTRHQLLHTGRREYSCEVCGKAYVTREELTRHMKYHSGIKKHACAICGKSYYESGHLTVHMRSHTNETPYQCQFCDVAFKSDSNLRRHQKTCSQKSAVECSQDELHMLRL